MGSVYTDNYTFLLDQFYKNTSHIFGQNLRTRKVSNFLFKNNMKL